MTVHLVKLCVGAESVDDLADWIERRLGEARESGKPVEQTHTTRMVPSRRDDILDGGSLYWVIKGLIQVRQTILDIRPFTGEDGIKRCHIVLEPALHATELQPRRPFQGWRYLKPEEAPRDITRALADGDIPDAMRRDLAELCLI